MFIGEIIKGWHKVLLSLSKPNADRLLLAADKIKFLEPSEK
jgi:hypothetical protein